MSLFRSPRVHKAQCDAPGEFRVHGSFVAPTATAGVKASKDLATLGTTHEWDTVVEAHTAGTPGNSITVKLEVDATANAKASLSCAGTGKTTSYDSVLEVKAAGVAGNLWKANFTSHAHAGAGVMINVDSTNKVIQIMFEENVSTRADIDTAIGALAGGDDLIDVKTAGAAVVALTKAADETADLSFAGGTAAQSVVRTGTNFVFKCTPTVTTVAALEALITALAGEDDLLAIKTGGTGANVIAATTVFNATNLTGGVTAATTASTGHKEDAGKRFTISRTGTGEYLATFQHKFTALKYANASLDLASAADLAVQAGGWDSATRALELHVATRGGVATDMSTNDGDRINLEAIFVNTTGA